MLYYNTGLDRYVSERGVLQISKQLSNLVFRISLTLPARTHHQPMGANPAERRMSACFILHGHRHAYASRVVYEVYLPQDITHGTRTSNPHSG